MKSLRSWNGNHWARRLSPSIWRSLKSWLRIMPDIWPMERWGNFFLWKETTMGLNLLPKSKKSYLLHALLLPLPSFFWGSILDYFLPYFIFSFILIAVLGWHLLCCLLGLHERHGQARPVCQFSHTEETERQSSGNSFHQEMAGEETCHRSLENMRAIFTNVLNFSLHKFNFQYLLQYLHHSKI